MEDVVLSNFIKSNEKLDKNFRRREDEKINGEVHRKKLSLSRCKFSKSYYKVFINLICINLCWIMIT